MQDKLTFSILPSKLIVRLIHDIYASAEMLIVRLVPPTLLLCHEPMSKFTSELPTLQ